MGKDLMGNELGRGISQRPDGTYMARYVNRYRKRKTLYGKNLKVLKRRLEKARYDSEYGNELNGGNITLTEWFEEFLVLYKKERVKEVTLYRIRQTFNTCKKDVIGNMQLKDIRGIHIQQLINVLSKNGFSYGTLNNLKALLNEMFKKAIGNGFIIINPCEAIILPRKERYEQRYLTTKEQTMFLESANGYVHYDIFCANLSCGMRIGELLGLKWSDIDFDKKTINIQRTLHYSRFNDNEVCHFFFTTP